MTEENKQELKACERCNGRKVATAKSEYGKYYVLCMKCLRETHDDADSEEAAIVAYNTRADSKTEVCKCQWQNDCDDTYSTECRNNFFFVDESGPKENNFKFCPFCGNKIEVN